MKEHSPAEAVQENYVAASCKDNGSYDSVVYCSAEDCKFVISRETITVPATGEHIYATEQGRVEATCTADGYVIMACGCGTTQTTTLPALNHDEVAHEAKAPTCTEIGWDAYVTCSRCDYTTYDEKAALEHNYNDGVVTTAPTCNEAGVKTFTCANDASHTYTETVDALGHDEVNHDAKAPTCTEIGWDAYVTCSRCDYTTYDEKVATGHNVVIDNVAVDATCTEAGVTEGKHCSVCNTVLSVKEEIPATGHSVKHFEAVDATFDSEGNFEYYSCLNCGKTFSDDACTVEATAIILPKLSLTDYTTTTAVADSVITTVFTLISDTVEYSVSVVADSYLLINRGSDIYVSEYDYAKLNSDTVTVSYDSVKGYTYIVASGATESLVNIKVSGASLTLVGEFNITLAAGWVPTNGDLLIGDGDNTASVTVTNKGIYMYGGDVIVNKGSTLDIPAKTITCEDGSCLIIDGTLNAAGVTITASLVEDASYEYGFIPGLYVRHGVATITGQIKTNSIQIGSEAENARGTLDATHSDNNIIVASGTAKIKYVFAAGELKVNNTGSSKTAIYANTTGGAIIDIRSGMTMKFEGGISNMLGTWKAGASSYYYYVSVEEGATIVGDGNFFRAGKEGVLNLSINCWNTVEINVGGEIKEVKVVNTTSYTAGKLSYVLSKMSFHTPVEGAVYTATGNKVTCGHLGEFIEAIDADGNIIYYQE